MKGSLAKIDRGFRGFWLSPVSSLSTAQWDHLLQQPSRPVEDPKASKPPINSIYTNKYFSFSFSPPINFRKIPFISDPRKTQNPPTKKVFFEGKQEAK